MPFRISPRVKKFAGSVRRLSHVAKKRVPHMRPRTVFVLVVLALGTGLLSGKYLQKTPMTNEKSPQKASRNLTGELTKETPTFKTILPAGTTIEEFGGWTRVSPKDRAAAYGYADTLAKTPIIVSQQELPDELKDDVEGQVNTLAEGYRATRIVKAGPTTIHIGTSAKGPQSVIFTKNSLLVLIKSSAKISDADWSAYVSSLE